MGIKGAAKQCFICVFIIEMIVAYSVYAKDKDALPAVTNINVPSYSLPARTVHIEGVVHVKIRTDGRVIIEAKAEDGNILLAKSAESNALTWKFVPHEPASFTITYKYKFVTKISERRVIFRLPHEVEIYDTRLPAPKHILYSPWRGSSDSTSSTIRRIARNP
jgi:hypothetical protein